MFVEDGGRLRFGNYSLKGAEISIILLPESVNDKTYDTYFPGWPEGKRTFKVEDLSYSSLRLEYEGTKSIFENFEIKNKNRRFTNKNNRKEMKKINVLGMGCV